VPKESRPDAAVVKTPILAAGAVLWRPQDCTGGLEIAVIHRSRYDDWSLPKGKVNPGETEPVTAVREIEEETGFRAHLGRRLTTVSYPVEQGGKKVRYWAARCVSGEFSVSDEVDELRWLPADQAMTALTYPNDRKVLRRFLKLPADTQTVMIVRHATAEAKPDTRATTDSVPSTSTVGLRPSRLSGSCSHSARANFSRPPGYGVRKHWIRWPRSWA